MRERAERGVVLVFVLFVVVLVGSLSSLALQASRGLARDTVQERGRLAAFWAAEGGLAHARRELARDPAWRQGEIRVGAAVVLVRADPEDAARQRFRIHARASVFARGKRALPIVVGLEAAVRRQGHRTSVESWRVAGR